ncbi:interactor of constitutive active ROPs 4-like isoform X1 [Primulina tabacum]|uniref:interactor of constitutive active ROPs 4-like isoform X1 n=2 Tax=Primulina tabacum TaxID=48773 RepID=UPI003F5942A1
MPRSRLTEMSQRQSPRGPPHLKTSSSDTGSLHRPRTEKSLKIPEGRSPRGVQSDPANKMKLGTRIAELESQLGQAQNELKNLKDQLASAESGKKVALDKPEMKSKKQQKVPEPEEILKKPFGDIETQMLKDIISATIEKPEDVCKETYVFEVAMETKTTSEPENPSFDELTSKNDEVTLLKNKLAEKSQELDILHQENESLRNELNEKSLKISSSQSERDELILRLNKADQELENTKASAFQMNEKLEAIEKAREELENEMKMLRVQTEQWRKAADAAASVLAGGTNITGRRIPERCGSMDKHYGSTFLQVGHADSPGQNEDDSDDVFGSGKRKGSGIKIFGELWKKKGLK